MISIIWYGLLGEVENPKKVETEMNTNSQSKRLLAVKRFGEYTIEITPH